MSLNVLVSAAVQRTTTESNNMTAAGSSSTTAQDSAKKKKKRSKPEEQIYLPSSKSPHLVGGGEEEEEKQKKRRAQIAEASRRSRARRKKEFQDFKEENDQLWSQLMSLRKHLQDLGVDVPPPPVSRIDRGAFASGPSMNNSSDDEEDEANYTPHPSPGISTASSPAQQQHHLIPTISGVPSLPNTASVVVQQPPLPWTTTQIGTSDGETDSTSPGNPACLSDFCQFFERRLSWYFTQLKQDALRSFASHLPYEEKNKIANLLVKLVFADNISPMVTPNIANAVTAARITAANNAEQALNQDKNVRL